MDAPRITVVGSYATGLTMKVERIPMVGETLLGTGYRVDYGGKGSNQAVGCARLERRSASLPLEKTLSVKWRLSSIATRGLMSPT